ncbi:MAG: hypothetical protein DBY17_10100 [Oscillospiraceae bacterium]|nr:MAG: hypothetical protein DBY17_10100 [Oscillospiraceae bacterium]
MGAQRLFFCAGGREERRRALLPFAHALCVQMHKRGAGIGAGQCRAHFWPARHGTFSAQDMYVESAVREGIRPQQLSARFGRICRWKARCMKESPALPLAQGACGAGCFIFRPLQKRGSTMGKGEIVWHWMPPCWN